MKQDFLAKLVQDQKRFATQLKIRWAVVVIAIWIVSVVVVVANIPSDWHRWQRENVAFFWSIFAIVILVATGVVASRRIRMHAHAIGLTCTECQKPLIGNCGMAVDSGRCPHCGEPVTDDDTK